MTYIICNALVDVLTRQANSWLFLKFHQSSLVTAVPTFHYQPTSLAIRKQTKHWRSSQIGIDSTTASCKLYFDRNAEIRCLSKVTLATFWAVFLT